VQPTDRHLEVIFGGRVIADTTRGLRVLETSHPPVYYFPIEDVRPDTLDPGARASYCEFKGEARYYAVVCGEHRIEDAAWSYQCPKPGYQELTGYVAFYPSLMDECRVDGEVVRPQPGPFYGGWITSDIVGPFKGEPGINGW
jgi:uncharacterized protein (DUF427 family)